MNSRPIMIAPAPSPSKSPSTDYGNDSASPMPYNCQPCVQRKVKCDKSIPICSTCSKGKFECFYRAPPPPRPRRRKRSEDVYERLARYERILLENGLLPTADSKNSPSYTKETSQSTQEPTTRRGNQLNTEGIGKLLSSHGKSLYINSRLLLDASKFDEREISEDEEDEQITPVGMASLTEDPISNSLLGVSQNLINFHPSHEDAMKLWAVHVQNVDPICRILHIPTAAKMVDTVSQQPAAASKAHECLLFAIYHLAVFSTTDEDCVSEFGQLRTSLLSKYDYAVRQALVNVSWLKTTEMPVMQALVIFLIAMRFQMDPNTFWILTGVAIRIAQRMGLHRDGESLGLPPFEVQMRRRLFWQLLPLDGWAGQVSGTAVSITPGSWDTKQPLNINDEQIYPGMTQQPEEQKGASEMIFFLARTELSNFYSRTGVKMSNGASVQPRDDEEVEKLINEVEGVIETKYLRYCDVVNPLHFLTLAIVRTAANVVRLHNRMPPLINKAIGDRERRELCTLAQKILDTKNTITKNENIKMFRWQFRAFFLWDALICILTSLAKIDFFSPAELSSTWNKLADFYSYHQEILEPKGNPQIVVGKVTLEAWAANPLRDSMPEPTFITTLRSQRKNKVVTKPPEGNTGGMAINDGAAENMPSVDALFGNLDGPDLNFDSDFNFSTAADWAFWDLFYQTQRTNYD